MKLSPRVLAIGEAGGRDCIHLQYLARLLVARMHATSMREVMVIMPTIKQTALQAIKNLPEDVDYDDIMEALYVQEKIARGVQQLDDGKYLTHEQVKVRVKEWSK